MTKDEVFNEKAGNENGNLCFQLGPETKGKEGRYFENRLIPSSNKRESGSRFDFDRITV